MQMFSFILIGPDQLEPVSDTVLQKHLEPYEVDENLYTCENEEEYTFKNIKDLMHEFIQLWNEEYSSGHNTKLYNGIKIFVTAAEEAYGCFEGTPQYNLVEEANYFDLFNLLGIEN